MGGPRMTRESQPNVAPKEAIVTIVGSMKNAEITDEISIHGCVSSQVAASAEYNKPCGDKVPATDRIHQIGIALDIKREGMRRATHVDMPFRIA